MSVVGALQSEINKLKIELENVEDMFEAQCEYTTELETQLATYCWTLASEERPKTRQRVYVICKTKEGKRFATMAEYIAPRTVLQEDYIDEDYSDSWFDYDEDADIYWIPGGWYEWQSTPDVNWFLTDKVTHYKPITLPGKE